MPDRCPACCLSPAPQGGRGAVSNWLAGDYRRPMPAALFGMPDSLLWNHWLEVPSG